MSLFTALFAYAIAIWLAGTCTYSHDLVGGVTAVFGVGTFFHGLWVDGW